MKHVPFDSIYRPDFEVVEQREGKVRYFPHTAQLPLLHRALNLEFRTGLPSGIAKTNAKSDGFRKVLLAEAVLYFCNLLNGARRDELRMFRLFDRDLLARVTVVQQVTEETPRGLCHRFCFHGGADFAPEVRLSGKELLVSDHMLQRFGARVPNPVGQDLTFFLLCFFASNIIALPVNRGRAFMVPYGKSFLAFPFQESETEYFITTCLTQHEVHDLGIEMPTQAFNMHYGREFQAPRVRNWIPMKCMKEYYDAWERKTPIEPVRELGVKMNWYRMASYIKTAVAKQGHGPGSQLCFLDDLPGPMVALYPPGKGPGQWDEVAACAETYPDQDWTGMVKERDEAAKQAVPYFENLSSRIWDSGR